MLGVSAQYIAGESVVATLTVNVVSNDDNLLQPLSSGFYPNPFIGSSTLNYSVKHPARLEIYNLKGQKLIGYCLSGSGQIVFSGCDERGNKLSAGIYFYRLDTGQEIITRKLMLLK